MASSVELSHPVDGSLRCYEVTIKVGKYDYLYSIIGYS